MNDVADHEARFHDHGEQVDPPYPQMSEHPLRTGVAKITTDNMDGTYVVDEQVWTGAAWTNGTAPGQYMGATARDINESTDGSVNDYVFFWEQYTQDGVIELIATVLAGTISGRVRVAKIVSNDGGGEYTIAEQIWDPDPLVVAWVPFGITVTGDGGGHDGSPNGDYIRGGTYGGKGYYELAGEVFTTFFAPADADWAISTERAVHAPNDSWDRDGAGNPIEGGYSPLPLSTYTGNPVVAGTSLSARDISENGQGQVGDFVIFWQQLDDNGDTETVIIVGFVHTALGGGHAWTILVERTGGKDVRLAFGDYRHFLGWWDSAGANWEGGNDVDGNPIAEPTSSTAIDLPVP